ncbi:isopeptide-forming domain-containing fimbrial protein [Companilactobacillus insicii]|uniref:isopeptide-forming domain-containing fimbrial protein n=1 Tax=Companilactobacillus insicii TaxID=1732567 RepID=UPI000F79D38B|nr:isopeptide-forming domain-containing fimbrial protein [Companilactobacillus insicii]
MKAKALLKNPLFILFIFSLGLISTIPVQTVTATQRSQSSKITWNPNSVFDDGIYTWQHQSNNKVANLKINDDLQLGYAFGLAQDTSGNVTTGGDDTIETDSSASGQNIQYSKINTFLNNRNKYISALFQQGWTGSTAKESVSPTSPDFMLVPNENTSSVTASKYSILSNFLSGKKYYVESLNANTRPAYKIAGDFIRNDSYGKYNLQMEIVLRPSPSNAAIVQRELYIKNNTNYTQKFGILYAEDTQLDGEDTIPIYSLENNNGIFIQSINYKLLFDRSLPDGPSNYTVSPFNSSFMDWTKGFSPANFSGVGTESLNLKYGALITSSLLDSSYTMKWPYTTLEPGQIKHYVSSVGISQPKYAIPKVTKSYINKTNSDGKNRIGDKLNFNLKVFNVGFKSKWSYTKLIDQIPDGLQIDPQSLTITHPDGLFSKLPSENYNSSTKTLTIPPALTVKDGESCTISFDATISPMASGTTITNVGRFYGIDYDTTDTEEKEYIASTNIPVERKSFDYSFTKQVRNVSNNETYFSDSTNAKIGDKVEFKVKFQVNSTSKNSLLSDSFIHETLPMGLAGNVGVTVITDYTDSSLNGQTSFTDSQNLQAWIQKIDPGKSVTIVFPATVTNTASGSMSNIATITNVRTSGNETLGTLSTNNANVIIQGSNTSGFTKTPDLIDFGTTNYYGENQNLTNTSTIGQLIVSHPKPSNYYVAVSYDNEDSKTQLKNENGDTLLPTNDGLIFIKERENSPSDIGSWMPITTDGTPIQSSYFNGDQNLTNYIGVGNWKLHIGPNTKPGKYTGILTWTMEDVLS